ncbi:MAG: mannose-6-phosphate isomerase [Flavobacteriales bacterium]|jgi:mannose-6-phosphate isomerase
MENNWYPLRFIPILKEKIWGGHQLRDLLNKSNEDLPFGESWELVGLPGDQSVVMHGALKGETLGGLCTAFAKALLGPKVATQFGTTFPLLIKFIDAAADLSVQLHPNDDIAKREHDCFGKAEMWYIMHAEPGARIIVGFNKTMTAQSFAASIEAGSLTEDLAYIPVKAGEAFFIDAGLIHAIGAGVVLAEIQQTSDVTYRVYDYNRMQADGTLRDLHIEAAKKAVHYSVDPGFVLDYDQNSKGVQVLKHSNYFKTDIVRLDKDAHRVNRTDSFTILIAVSGAITVTCGDRIEVLATGQTTLIPAACAEVTISGEGATFLEVYL